MDIQQNGAAPSPKDDTDERWVDNGIRPKLLPKTPRPFEVIRCTEQMVTILENGLENTKSVDRIIIAPHSHPTPQVVPPTPQVLPLTQVNLWSPVGQGQDRTLLEAITDRRSPASTPFPWKHTMHARSKEITVDPTIPLIFRQNDNTRPPPGIESTDTKGLIDSVVGHEYTMFAIRYRVRWYGLTAFHDAMETPHYICNNLFIRLWIG